MDIVMIDHPWLGVVISFSLRRCLVLQRPRGNFHEGAFLPQPVACPLPLHFFHDSQRQEKTAHVL
jgi:hypothetical protein